MLDSRMKTFMVVAERKNFSRAADYLRISQPAVSIQIQQLEDTLGVKLFKRYEKEITLTPAGKVLLDYAQRISVLADEATREINRLQNEVRGSLRLGATLTIGEYLLPAIMGAFKQKFPEVDFLLEVENTQTIENMLSQHEIDLALVEGPITNKRLIEQEFMTDEMLVLFAPGHRWAGRDIVSWDEFTKEKLILREPGSGTRKVIENAVTGMGKKLGELNVFMEMGSTQAIKALVKENLGVTVLSKLTVQEELAAGSLKAAALEGCSLKRTFRFLLFKEQVPSLACEHFMKFCKEYIAGNIEK